MVMGIHKVTLDDASLDRSHTGTVLYRAPTVCASVKWRSRSMVGR